MTALAAAPAQFGRANAIHVIQGQCAVTDDPAIVICTLLGSCVSACIRDPAARVGGLNHFLLPEGSRGSESLSYGVNAMELLINDLLRKGARRDRLEAKLFGGARVINGVSDIGRQNAEFAKRFLHDEAIAFVGGSLEGTHARRIEFWPATGRLRLQIIDCSNEVLAAELHGVKPTSEGAEGALELF